MEKESRRKRALSATDSKSPGGKRAKGPEAPPEEVEPETTSSTSAPACDIAKYPLRGLPDPAVFLLWGDAVLDLVGGSRGMGDHPVLRLKSACVEAYAKKQKEEEEEEDEDGDGEGEWADGVVRYDVDDGEDDDEDDDDDQGEEGEEKEKAHPSGPKLLTAQYEREFKTASELAPEIKEKHGVDQYGWWWELTLTRAEPAGDVPKKKITLRKPWGYDEEDEEAEWWVREARVAGVEEHRMMDEMIDYLIDPLDG